VNIHSHRVVDTVIELADPEETVEAALAARRAEPDHVSKSSTERQLVWDRPLFSGWFGAPSARKT